MMPAPAEGVKEVRAGPYCSACEVEIRLRPLFYDICGRKSAKIYFSLFNLLRRRRKQYQQHTTHSGIFDISTHKSTMVTRTVNAGNAMEIIKEIQLRQGGDRK
jgi:hypothetical protein